MFASFLASLISPITQVQPSNHTHTHTDARFWLSTYILTAQTDAIIPPSGYLLLQNHINVFLAEQQRGHGGVQLIFHISASRSTITPSLTFLCPRQPFPSLANYIHFSGTQTRSMRPETMLEEAVNTERSQNKSPQDACYCFSNDHYYWLMGNEGSSL